MTKIDGQTENLKEIKEGFHKLFEEIDTSDDKQLDILLNGLRSANVNGYEEGIREIYDKALRMYLDTISDEKFNFDRSYCYKHLEYGAMISNIAYSCDLGSTAAYIEKVRNQPQGLYKRLLLTSARSDIKEIEDLCRRYHEDIPLFNNWICNTYQVASGGFLDKTVVNNMIKLSEAVKDNDFVWGIAVGDLFNCVTYMDNPYEKEIRRHISKAMQAAFGSVKKFPAKKTNRIAIYCENWFTGHSTHRTVAKYFEKLFDKYEVVLLHGERYLRVDPNRKDEEKFKEKHKISIFGVFEPLEMSIVGPDRLEFDALIYPDAGFDVLSVILANMRIAPVQISMTGFPISIFGGQIDYFMSGIETECLDKAQENYDERVICLPGFGAIHERPKCDHPFIRPEPKAEIIVGGSWIGPKTHYYMADMLKEVFKRTTKKCELRVFPGINWFYNNKSYIPFVENLSNYFDESLYLRIIEGGEISDYLRLLSEVDCAVDSFPWGGSNTCSDCIHLNKPVVMREGDRWFNRIGPAMLRSIGLEELVAKTDNDYIDKAVRLIEDDQWRIELTYRLYEMNKPGGLIDKHIYNCDGAADAFANFVEDAINGLITPGRDPVVIECSPEGNNRYKYHKPVI